jgi:hypothetical protein
MQTTRPSIGKYVCGMAASLIIFLAGGWLILAPFALGYQPYNASWVSQTTNDFATGIPVAVVALIAFTFFFMSLTRSLAAAGVVVAQPKAQPQAAAQYQSAAAAPQAAAASQSDLDKTLATLAAALAADLTARRQGGGDQLNDQSQTILNRREAQ